MIYSDIYVGKQNKLPTVIGFLFVLLIGIFFSRLFLGNANLSKASLKVAKRVEIVNLSPSQASIFWQTDKKESGWVIYGDSENKENKIVLDDKDLNNVGEKKGKYVVHLATLKELLPGKKYYFKIVTDNNEIIVRPDGKSFSFVTPLGNLNGLQNISPAFGKVLRSNSVDPLTNSYIMLSVKNGYPLLTQIRSEGDGSWLIPLNQIYSKDSQSVVTVSDTDKIIIEIINSDGEGLTITTIKSKISPLPQTTVFTKDKNFSFVEDENVLSAVSTPSAPKKVPDKKTADKRTEIVYPKEGSLIPGSIPLIKGVTTPGTKIEITVNSKKTYSATATSDKEGNWSYLLPENLELGPHTIVVKTKDSAGNEIMITRKFTIIAQQGNEGRVLGTASGAATIAPTVVYNSPTPTIYSSSSATMTPTPPVSGNSFLGTIIGGLSLVIIGGGILLAF